MSLPVYRVIWAGSDRSGAHDDHLHVEGDPLFGGTPPLHNPGMSPAIKEIYAALRSVFGNAAYFLSPVPVLQQADWFHMGWYHRRYIGSGSTWSQHSWSNAIDIGPYYGVSEQRKFFNFLTGRATLEDMLTEHEINQVKKLVKALDEVGSNGGFAKYAVDLIRRERDLPLHKPVATPSGVPEHQHTLTKTGGIA